MENIKSSMKKHLKNYFVIALGILGLINASVTYAGSVIEYAFAGPGLEDAIFEPADDSEHPSEFFYDKIFAEAEYIDLLMLVGNSPPNGDSNSHPVTISERIFNATGIVWTDYHLELGFVEFLEFCDDDDDSCDGEEIPGYEFTTAVSELAFTDLDQDTFASEELNPESNPNSIWLDNGFVGDEAEFDLQLVFNLPDYADVLEFATLFDFEFEGDCFEIGCYVIALRQFPSIGDVTPPNPVPVPASFWLFGTALIGFIGISRRRKIA